MEESEKNWEKVRQAIRRTSPPVPSVDLTPGVMFEIEKPEWSLGRLFPWVISLTTVGVATLIVFMNVWVTRPTYSTDELLLEKVSPEVRLVVDTAQPKDENLIAYLIGGE